MKFFIRYGSIFKTKESIIESKDALAAENKAKELAFTEAIRQDKTKKNIDHSLKYSRLLIDYYIEPLNYSNPYHLKILKDKDNELYWPKLFFTL